MESNYPDLIKRLLNDPTIKQARVTTAESQKLNIKEDEFGAIITLDREDEEEEMESDFTCSFQISKEKVEEVKRRCNELVIYINIGISSYGGI